MVKENTQKERHFNQKSREKELLKYTVKVSRVAKVVKGGKNFKFAALVVVGDGKGRCGYGSGKAAEVSSAIRKATDKASEKLIRIPLKESRTFFHDSLGKYGAGEVCIRAAKPGQGVIAGGAMRAIFNVMGVQDVVGKILRSRNPHNVVRATFQALQNMETPRSVSRKRDKKIAEIYGKQIEGEKN